MKTWAVRLSSSRGLTTLKDTQQQLTKWQRRCKGTLTSYGENSSNLRTISYTAQHQKMIKTALRDGGLKRLQSKVQGERQERSKKV
ncbi:hypothetical protein MRB53_020862 [Persea americana]|uniref:Uncharacterized protein n=1 Tax=Persea americana TaxID=3435 RepID=A0ACC2L2C1_PERAE|nr:hypothetical protein MRB53_020862 [Persea americana]